MILPSILYSTFRELFSNSNRPSYSYLKGVSSTYLYTSIGRSYRRIFCQNFQIYVSRIFWYFHIFHFFSQLLESEAFQIFCPLYNFQTLDMFPVFPAFPVFLGKDKEENLVTKLLDENGLFDQALASCRGFCILAPQCKTWSAAGDATVVERYYCCTQIWYMRSKKLVFLAILMAFVKRETVYRPFLRDLKSVLERFVHLKASGQKRSTEIWGSLYIISRFPLSRGALSLKGGYLLQYYQYIKIGNCYIRVARADGKWRWWEIINANDRVLILILHPTLFCSRYSTGL